jgi:hypothetical protein
VNYFRRKSANRIPTKSANKNDLNFTDFKFDVTFWNQSSEIYTYLPLGFIHPSKGHSKLKKDYSVNWDRKGYSFPSTEINLPQKFTKSLPGRGAHSSSK